MSPALTLLLLLAAPAPAAAPDPCAQQGTPLQQLLCDNRFLTFAEGYRADSSGMPRSDFAKIGYYHFDELDRRSGELWGSVTLRYFWYHAALNKTNWIARQGHQDDGPPILHPPMPRPAPYLGEKGPCAPGAFRIPAYADYKEFSGDFTTQGDVLKVKIGKTVHEWRLKDGAKRLLERSRPSYLFRCTDGGAERDCSPGFRPPAYNHVIDGTTYSKTHGFGYLNAAGPLLQQPIGKQHLARSYDGELYQSIGYKGAPKIDDSVFCPGRRNSYQRDGEYSLISDWCHSTNRLSVHAFTDGDLPAYSWHCRTSSEPRMYCQTTMLFNYAPWTKLLIYVNGGHDYDMNGCYGSHSNTVEPGHANQLLGVWEGGRVAKIVWVEHSYEYDGYPIVSVGHYYAP